MRVGHTTRSDHFGHDLPHTEVRVRRVASSKKKKGPEEEGANARIKEKGKRGGLLFSFFLLYFGHVLVGLVGAHGWLVTPVVSLFFDNEIVTSYRWRDLQRSWMLIRQRVWGLL
uniref:Transmembrane protein n=1 Tax=Fagus sylvatica TaxID=28930 RepID=A0A2N9G899_FAGSY